MIVYAILILCLFHLQELDIYTGLKYGGEQKEQREKFFAEE